MGAPAAMTPISLHRFVGDDIAVVFEELDEAIPLRDVNGTSLRRLCSVLGIKTERTDDNAARIRRVRDYIVQNLDEWETAWVDGSPKDSQDEEHEEPDVVRPDDEDGESESGSDPNDSDSDGEDDEFDPHAEQDEAEADAAAEAESESESESGSQTPKIEFMVSVDSQPQWLDAKVVAEMFGAAAGSDPNGGGSVPDGLPEDWLPEGWVPPSGDDSSVPQDDAEHPTHEMLPRVLAHLAAGSHVFLYGPKGSGKSTAYETYAKIVGMDFEAYSCNPHMTGSTLVGYALPTGGWLDGPLTSSIRNNRISGIDEIDFGSQGAMSVMNMVTAQGFIRADEMLYASPEWRVIATANTNGQGATMEYVGRNKMDEALLDRFKMVHWDTDTKLERYIVRRLGWHNTAQCDELLWAVAIARNNIEAYGLRTTLSMRSTISMGKTLVAMQSPEWEKSGLPVLTFREVFTDTVSNKLSPDLAAKLTDGLF